MKPLLVLLLIFVPVCAVQNAKFEGVTKIYVDELGADEGADLVREKIKIRLLKSKRFTLVEDKEKADAVLVGSAGSIRAGGTSGRFEGAGAFRLINRTSSETIWFYEFKSGWFRRGSESSNVAKAAVDRLERDAKKR